jgi:hypothetical protein
MVGLLSGAIYIMGRKAKLKKQRKIAQQNFSHYLSCQPDRHPEFFPQKFPRPTEDSSRLIAQGQNQLVPPTIPEPELIRYWLSHPDTADWILSQWSLLLGFNYSVSHAHASNLVALMLESLTTQTLNDLNRDARVLYSNSPYFEMNIGLNVWHWTLWTSIKDKLTDFTILSQEHDDLQLQQLPISK